MNELLTYLITHFDFLYNNYNARFVDSRVHGPHAMLILEMGDLRLRFVRDRSQLFLDFQSGHRPHDEDWFSYDVVHQFLTSIIADSALLDEGKVNFVRENIEEISSIFSKDNRATTEKALHEFEKDRAKRIFG